MAGLQGAMARDSAGISGIPDYITPKTEESEVLKELKGVNKNIEELKKIMEIFLNSLIEQQEMLSEKQDLMEMDVIYEKYGKPLEKEHKGKFACITPDGDFVTGKDSVDAEKRAGEEGLEDFILFQIGNPGGGIDM